MKHFVMVLNDGETYTSLDGCQMLVFDDSELEDGEITDSMVKDDHGIQNVVAKFAVGKDTVRIDTWRKGPLRLYGAWSR